MPVLWITFMRHYMTVPVIVGVGNEEELSLYCARFWTNIEMLKYSKNKHVYLLSESLSRPAPIANRVLEIAKNENIQATFNCDRLRILLLRFPFAPLLMGFPLNVLRKEQEAKRDINLKSLEELVDYIGAVDSLVGDTIRQRLPPWLVFLTIPYLCIFPPLPSFRRLTTPQLYVLTVLCIYLAQTGYAIYVLYFYAEWGLCDNNPYLMQFIAMVSVLSGALLFERFLFAVLVGAHLGYHITRCVTSSSLPLTDREKSISGTKYPSTSASDQDRSTIVVV